MRLSLSCPSWVPGDVEFRVDGKELQVLFGVECGVLEPYQSLYIEGGMYVGTRGDSKVVGGIAMWSENRRKDCYVKRRAQATGI